MLFLSYHENASCSASPIESDLESDATSLPTDVGCMRRSCGPRGSRNDSIGYRSGQRVRENSCTASLAQERVVLHLSVLHLPKVAFAFTWTLGRLLVITTKRAIDSRARSYLLGGVHPTGCLTVGHNPVVELKVRPTGLFSPHRPRPTSTSRCLVVETASRPTNVSASRGGPFPKPSVILRLVSRSRRI